MNRTVTLTDKDGNALGEADLLEAHAIPGMLHRAFSVYVFREGSSGKEMLIQQRAQQKLLWPGIWANTCCSHPFAGEAPEAAGKRRLREELGCECDLKEAGTFVYQAIDPERRGAEHEHVTILVASANLAPVPNPDEVSACRWVPVRELQADMRERPDTFAPWFHLGLPKALAA